MSNFANSQAVAPKEQAFHVSGDDLSKPLHRGGSGMIALDKSTETAVMITADTNGNLNISGSLSGSGGTDIYSTAKGQFTATVKTNAQNIIVVSGVTLTALGVKGAGRIEVQDTVSGEWEKVDLSSFSISGNEITLNNVSATASGWLTTDTVLMEIQRPDPILTSQGDGLNVSVSNPESSKETVYEPLATAQVLTGSWLKLGSVISMDGNTIINALINGDVNNSDFVDLKVISRATFAGAVSYEGQAQETIYRLWNYSSDGDVDLALAIAVGANKYIEFQVKAGTVGASAGTITMQIAKKWVQVDKQTLGFINEIQKDLNTNSIVYIDYPHHEIHAGDAYVALDNQSVDTTTLKWVVTTPDTEKHAHMVFGVFCTGQVTILVTEGADRTGTTAITPINRDRNSAETSALTIHRGYSAGTTDGAVTILNKTVGVSGATPSAGNVPAGDRSLHEFILKQDTQYIVSVTTVDAEFVSLELDWYEHTSKIAGL